MLLISWHFGIAYGGESIDMSRHDISTSLQKKTSILLSVVCYNVELNIYNFQSVFCRVYQVANVKTEWNLIKTLPDLSGTGLHSFLALIKLAMHVELR